MKLDLSKLPEKITTEVNDELIFPIIQTTDGGANIITHRVSIGNITKVIKEKVLEGDEIEMVVTEDSIKFRKVEK